MALEPIFASDDIKRQLPQEHLLQFPPPVAGSCSRVGGASKVHYDKLPHKGLRNLDLI